MECDWLLQIQMISMRVPVFKSPIARGRCEGGAVFEYDRFARPLAVIIWQLGKPSDETRHVTKLCLRNMLGASALYVRLSALVAIVEHSKVVALG